MSSSEQPARKAELRALARRIAAGDRACAATVAWSRLLELPEFARARTIAFYSAIGDEVPVDAVALESRSQGHRTVYPIRTEAGIEMGLATRDDSLRLAMGGIREPEQDSIRVPVEEIDAFLVPGLMFDRNCRRLGRGGGHYDRLLGRARVGAASIGICYAEHVVDELPEDPWDVAMDLVVTDRFVVRRFLRGVSG